MKQKLSINGKEYVPISHLVASSTYTSDYIRRLAVDEKILGTQVGRIWFIEPESFKTFLLKTDVEKKISASELSQKRKSEQTLKKEVTIKVSSNKRHSLFAFGQAVAVVSCGLLIGSLSFVASNDPTNINTLVQGSGISLSFLATSIYSLSDHTESLTALSTESVLVRSMSVSATSSDEAFAVLPIFPERDRMESSAQQEKSQQQSPVENLQFSDETKVVVNDRGDQFIVPIFKENSQGGDGFLLVSAKDAKK